MEIVIDGLTLGATAGVFVAAVVIPVAGTVAAVRLLFRYLFPLAGEGK